VARVVERPSLSAAEAVALNVRDAKEVVDTAVLRQRVAEEAQFRGIGIAGAVREMARLERDGWQQVGREAERQQTREAPDRGAPERGGENLQRAVQNVIGELSRALTAHGSGGGGGGEGDAAASTPSRRRRRDQDRGQER
jgi:hypothetical protein